MAKKRSYLQSLFDRGFDESTYDFRERTWTPKCSGCLVICVNGLPTHEIGCPTERRILNERAREERRLEYGED